jgi:hypothetical protein
MILVVFVVVMRAPCSFLHLSYSPTSLNNLRITLQRRARRHATINVVDFSDVTRFQNMVDGSDNVSEQNICTQIKM